MLARNFALRVLSFEVFTSDVNQIPLLKEHESVILSAESIVEIFYILGKYISFFNYELIELIIEDVGTEEDKMKLKQYEAAFSEFFRRNVFEIPPHIYGQQLTHGKEHNVVVFKCTPKAESTLQTVKRIQIEITKILGIQLLSLQLCSIERGCLELHFLVPAFLTEYVLTSAESCAKALQDVGVRLVNPAPLPVEQSHTQETPSGVSESELSTPKEKFEKLEKEFRGLRDATLHCLRTKSDKTEHLFQLFRTRLALLRASLSKKHVRYFSSVSIAKVLSSQSFEEIFSILDGYWSVLNCSLLLHIIMKFTLDDSLRALAESFRSSRKAFRTSAKLSQLKEMDVGAHVPSEFTEISMVLSQPKWEMYTLENVQTLREALTHKAFLQPFTLQFVSASPGSVLLTWALPNHLAPLFADSLDDSFLQTQGVDTVQVGGVPMKDFREQHPAMYNKMEDTTELSKNLIIACSESLDMIADLCLQCFQLEKDSSEMLRTTALEEVSNGNLSFVSMLLRAAGLDLEWRDSEWFQQTALHKVAKYGKAHVVKVLIDAGANLEATDKWGRTVLLIAAVCGKAEAVKVLIEAGASLDAKDNSGSTALHLAIDNNHSTEVIKVLIEAGASLDAQDNDGITALMLAAAKETSPLHSRMYRHSSEDSMVKTLIDAKANTEAKDKRGHTALDFAIAYGGRDGSDKFGHKHSTARRPYKEYMYMYRGHYRSLHHIPDRHHSVTPKDKFQDTIIQLLSGQHTHSHSQQTRSDPSTEYSKYSQMSSHKSLSPTYNSSITEKLESGKHLKQHSTPSSVESKLGISSPHSSVGTSELSDWKTKVKSSSTSTSEDVSETQSGSSATEGNT